MLDFKCVINPYQVYVTERDWAGAALHERAQPQLDKTPTVMLELTTRLKNRTYHSEWQR